jgi:hypothetical protein
VLERTNAQEMARLLEFNKNCGFPGIVGLIDCMHWSWKNYPDAWHRQFKDYTKDSTIILEAVADHETWIWHALGCPVLAMISMFFRGSFFRDPHS